MFCQQLGKCGTRIIHGMVVEEVQLTEHIDDVDLLIFGTVGPHDLAVLFVEVKDDLAFARPLLEGTR